MIGSIEENIESYKELLSKTESLKNQLIKEASKLGKIFNYETGNLLDIDESESVLLLEIYFCLGNFNSDYYGMMHGFEPLTLYNKKSLYYLLNNESATAWIDFLNDLICDTASEEFIDTGNIKNLITLSDLAYVNVFDVEEVNSYYNKKIMNSIYSPLIREGLVDKIGQIELKSQSYRNVEFSGSFSLIRVTKDYYEKVLSSISQYCVGEKYVRLNAPFKYNIDKLDDMF